MSTSPPARLPRTPFDAGPLSPGFADGHGNPFTPQHPDRRARPQGPRPHAAALAALAATALVTLSGCATPGGGGSAGPAPVALPVTPAVPAQSLVAAAPAAWQAPRPHQGDAVELQRWWARFDDPVLSELIERSQAASPTLSSARARVEQARATVTAAGAALGPTLDGTASALRGKPDLQTRSGLSLSAGVQAGWELDLFGANRAGQQAAQARLAGATAGWHDARVSVAAETGATYLQLRACEAQVQMSEADAASRAETARLTGLAEQAGLQSPSAAALARASAAQGRTLLTAQRTRCDSLAKALVSLTALDEPALRSRLAPGQARLSTPQPVALSVAAVPAELLRQRPDLRSAEAEWVAAAFDRDQAAAQRLPQVRLSGAIGATRLSGGGDSVSGATWTLGPVTVTLPIFDGGRRQAQTDAAQARLDDAARQFAGRVREATREVENALLQLRSAEERSGDAQAAARDFELSFRAAEARQRGGLASLFELEDARRTAVAANSALIDLQRERLAAWIDLYRAVGGGWTLDEPLPPVAGARAAAR